MSSLQYNSIFEKFLGNITDYDFVSLSISDSYELMTEYLHKSLAETYVNRLFSSYELDDEINTLTYEMKQSISEDNDAEFISSALAKWMVYEWLHKQVRSITNTAQFFGGAEQKFYAQANHLSELRGLMDDAYKEARFFIQDRGYIKNSYLGGS